VTDSDSGRGLLGLAEVDKAVFIWHVDLGKAVTVQQLVLIDYAIEIKHIGGNLIDLYIAQ